MKIKSTLFAVISLVLLLIACNEENDVGIGDHPTINSMDIRELNYDWLDDIDPEVANDIKSRLAWLNEDKTRAVGFPAGVTGAAINLMDSYLNPEGHDSYILTLAGTDGVNVSAKFVLWGHDYARDIVFHEQIPQMITGGSVTFTNTSGTIPAYYWWENDRRIIALQIETQGTWWELGFFYQQPVLPQEKFSTDLYTTYGGVIQKNGGDITVTLPGGSYQLPQGMSDRLHFRVVSNSGERIDSVYFEGANLMMGRTATLSIPELADTNPMVFNIQWKYELAGSDLTSIPSNLYLMDWDWIDFETGFQMNETVNYIVSEGRIINELPAQQGIVRLYLKKGENSTNLSEIDFRAQADFHRYHNMNYHLPKGYLSIDTVKGVDSPININGVDFDGYADITIPAVTEADGWVQWLSNLYPTYNYNIATYTQVANWNFQYYSGSEWLTLTTVSQTPYYLNPSYQESESGQLTAAGGRVVLAIGGWWAPNTVIFQAGSFTRTQLYSDPVEPDQMSIGNSKNGRVILDLYPNTTGNREIYFHYTIDGGITWTLWDTTISASVWKLPTPYPMIQP